MNDLFRTEPNVIAKVNDSTNAREVGRHLTQFSWFHKHLLGIKWSLDPEPRNKGMKVETEMCLSQLSKHSQAEGNVGGYYRREVSTWFDGRRAKGVTTKSRASEEIAWNNWQGGKMEEFPGRKWKREMEIMVWSAFVGRGKSHRNLERRVCRKTSPFYLSEDKSGPGECGFKNPSCRGETKMAA